MKDVIRSASFASIEGNVVAAHCPSNFFQFYRHIITHLLQETWAIIWHPLLCRDEKYEL